MNYGSRITPEPLRTFDSATLSGTYQAIGSAVAHVGCLAKIVNNSTVGITISWNGSTDHDFIPANSFALYDITTNAGGALALYIPIGTTFYAKGSAGVGNIYLIVLYPS